MIETKQSQHERQSDPRETSLWEHADCGELGSLVRRIATIAVAEHVAQEAARSGGTMPSANLGRIEL